MPTICMHALNHSLWVLVKLKTQDNSHNDYIAFISILYTELYPYKWSLRYWPADVPPTTVTYLLPGYIVLLTTYTASWIGNWQSLLVTEYLAKKSVKEAWIVTFTTISFDVVQGYVIVSRMYTVKTDLVDEN